MGKIPCSVGILTRNSAATLRRALESVRDFDDIIICDGGSTDETLTIASEFDAHVISQDMKFQNADGSLADYSGVRNQCLEVARHDWFLYIDSDEVAAPELVSEIRTIVANPNPLFLVYNVSPRIVLDETRVIEHSSNYPGWQKRFFNRTTDARFRKAVHERIGFDESRYPVGSLKGHWHYFITSTPDPIKNAKYSRMEASIHQTRKFGTFLSFTSKKLVTALKISIKSLWNLLRYRGKDTMPLALEFTRVHYQLSVVKYFWQGFLGKKI